MARDPKEWAEGVDCYDVINVFSPCEFEVNREGFADLIREAQEDGAAEWKARSETLTDDNMAMAAEIAELRSRLSNVANTAQAAANGWEPAQGLEAIYHIATTEPEKAPGEEPGGPEKRPPKSISRQVNVSSAEQARTCSPDSAIHASSAASCRSDAPSQELPLKRHLFPAT